MTTAGHSLLVVDAAETTRDNPTATTIVERFQAILAGDRRALTRYQHNRTLTLLDPRP